MKITALLTVTLLTLCCSAALAQAPPIDNDLTYRALSYDVARQVEDVMRERQDFYWAIAGGAGAVFLTFLTFVGFGQLRDMRSAIREQVKAELTSEISTQVEQRVLATLQTQAQDLSQRIDLFSLDLLLAKARSDDGYSDADADAMQNRIINLSKSEGLSKSREFKQKVDQALDAYFGAGLWDRLMALDDAIRPTLQSDASLTSTLLQGYMRALFGETEPEEEIAPRFLSYAEASRRLRYPERSIPYLMIYRYWVKDKNWERSIANLFSDCKDLTAEERQDVLDILDRTADPAKLAKTPDAAIVRIAEKGQAFNAQYAGEIAKLRSSIPKRADAG